MPTITEEVVTGYAHCRDARCDGYSQQEVPAVRILTEQSYKENGGDIPGTERSWTSFRFVNDGHDEDGRLDPDAENDVPCPSCGHYREITGTPRPSYQGLSGFSQKGLLGAPRYDPAKANTERDAKVAELEAKVERLLEALGEKDEGDG